VCPRQRCLAERWRRAQARGRRPGGRSRRRVGRSGRRTFGRCGRLRGAGATRGLESVHVCGLCARGPSDGLQWASTGRVEGRVPWHVSSRVPRMPMLKPGRGRTSQATRRAHLMSATAASLHSTPKDILPVLLATFSVLHGPVSMLPGPHGGSVADCGAYCGAYCGAPVRPTLGRDRRSQQVASQRRLGTSPLYLGDTVPNSKAG
jgi:hypothetical protein